MFKNILMTIIVATFIGCGNGGDATSEVVVANDTQFYDENTTTVFDFNNSVVITPTVNIPFEGGEFTITIIPTKDKNLILEENAIMITKSIDNHVVDSEWANVYKDVVHDVYQIEGKINYPYNYDENNITSSVQAIYYLDGKTEVIQTVEVIQMGNHISIPTVTADYEQFTVVTDENGNITITENPPSEFIVDNITDDDYINIAESTQIINVMGRAKPNASITFVINDNTYTGIADENGYWSIPTQGSDLAIVDTFTITAVGVDEYNQPYTETAISRHLIKTSVDATVTINNITDDNNITLVEANTIINVFGVVTGDLTAGDNIVLEVDGNTFQTTVEPNGTWVIPVDGQIIHNTNTTTVTATGIDVANNPISESFTKFYYTE